jgi:hypothetical protein
MRRASALWEVFVLRFEEALERYRKRRLTADEAGEVLGMSGRNFRRLIMRYNEDGAEGLRDRRLGRASPRRAPAAELTRMQILYQERYRDFTVKHFHEQLQASLMARLDRLGPAAREIAQTGAAIGREFSYELVTAVAPRSEAETRGALDQLAVAGLVFQHGTPPSAEYQFKHAPPCQRW